MLNMTNEALLKALGKFTPDEVEQMIADARKREPNKTTTRPYVERAQAQRRENARHLFDVLQVMGCPEAQWWDGWWYDWDEPQVVCINGEMKYCEAKLRLQNYSGEKKEVIFELS